MLLPRLMPTGSVRRLTPKPKRVLRKLPETKSLKMQRTRQNVRELRPTIKNTSTFKPGLHLKLLNQKKRQRNRVDSLPRHSKPRKMAAAPTLRDIGTRLPAKLKSAPTKSPETRSLRTKKMSKSDGEQQETRRSMMI